MIFWEHLGNAAVQKEDWKLVSKKDKNWELYNLKKTGPKWTTFHWNKSKNYEGDAQSYKVWAKQVGVVE